ncbi:hypothetical protein I3843_08G030300 [Carya illinoinensis]|uniref:Transmembrane protein n=1 Tax=Carya illinoinensis TaxID=32201 RepID=A0A922EB62_CARIL|nr:hypothetical protein I3842_08G030800 [Carya illinoinensis]KAG7966031.1 hypothetical protein I3843_08G030300 [Carya illinoinensis]
MKSSSIIFLCLLMTIFSHIFPTISTPSPSPSLILLQRRLPMRKLSMLLPYDKHKYHKIQDGEEMKGSTIEEGSVAFKSTSSRDNLDEIVYHIDYHGVTTHPTPTPKQPKS